MTRIPYINEKYYTFEDLDQYLDHVIPVGYAPPLAYTSGHVKKCYMDMIATFDIESTSAYVHYKKTAYMYVWQFSLSGLVILGRTWDQFETLLDAIKERLGVEPCFPESRHPGKMLPIYIHNESYEFQFIRKLRAWREIFALDSHKPIRALDLDGFEFRCSYVLSGLGLGKLEPRNGVRKQKGDLDYRKIRTQDTPLTEKEIGYCVDDVRVLASWLDDKLIDNGDTLATVPMTRTGYVRRDTRYHCFQDAQYRALMKSLTLTPKQYKQLKRAFAGGFTHANAMYAGITLEDVHSYDITSSYPTVMVAEKFPMSRFKPYTLKSADDFERNLKRYCCLFEVRFRNLRPRLPQDNPISRSKCIEVIGETENNGRIVSADYLSTVINEVDYSYIRRFYEWDGMAVVDFSRASKGYLPKPFVEAIIKYYEQKTKLKNKPGEEVMYAKFKEFVNALYGMTVTDLIKDVWQMSGSGEWYSEESDPDEAIDKANKSKNRFLYYPWGVWTTSYARRNLFEAIAAVGDDYVYSDTDSVKFLNLDKHKSFFDDYNRKIVGKLVAACKHHGIDPARVKPQNVDGEECPLGIFDYEGRYRRFKTLGAKRYLVESWNKKTAEWELHSTVAGLNKSLLPQYLSRRSYFYTTDDGQVVRAYDPDPFSKFSDRLFVPPNWSGKLTHTYVDEYAEFDVTDYMGNTSHVETFGGVHLEEQPYDLGMSDVYLDYLYSLCGGPVDKEVYF